MGNGSRVVLALLALISIGCQSSPKVEAPKKKAYDDSYLGCISAYTYWQIKLNNGSKFGEADAFCKKQKYMIDSARIIKNKQTKLRK